MIDEWDAEFRKLNPEFYPGSRHKIGEPHTQPFIEEWAAKPRIYLVNGQETEFFTSGQLAAALGRASVTIRKWEREGVIPKATHRLPGRGGDPRGNRRLYTKEQVRGIVRIAAEEGLLKGDQRPISNTAFTDKVIDLFRRAS